MLKDFTLSLELEPTENRVVQTAAIFWSHDVNTAKIYIELLRKGTPIILNKDVTVRVMMLFDDENKSEHIYTAKIEDELKGLVSITLEESMRMYVGQVTCGVYVDYQNEEKTDNGYFTFGMRRSLIDKDMPELQKLYVSDFEKALNEYKKKSEEFKQTEIDLNNRVEVIENNIKENNIATKGDLNSYKKRVADNYKLIQSTRQAHSDLEPAFCVVDDDSRIGVWTKLKPMFDELGAKFSVAVITSRIDKSDNHLSSDNLRQLEREGFEICSHTQNHRSLISIPIEEAELELKNSKEDLERMGVSSRYLMYPFGHHDNEIIKLTRKYYEAAATMDYPNDQIFNERPLQPYRIGRQGIGIYGIDPTDRNEIKKKIDNAVKNKTMCVLMTHIDETPADQIDTIIWAVKYIQSLGYPVTTFGEAYDKHRNALEFGNHTMKTEAARGDDYFVVDAAGHVKTNFGKTFNAPLRKYDINTPASEFKPNMKTDIVIRYIDAKDFPESSAGLLETYKMLNVNDPVFQTYTIFGSGVQYIRYWADNSWTEFNQIGAYVFGNLGEVTMNTPATAFPKKKTIVHFIRQIEASAFPESRWGILTTTRPALTTEAVKQTYEIPTMNLIYERVWDNSENSWGAFEPLPQMFRKSGKTIDDPITDFDKFSINYTFVNRFNNEGFPANGWLITFTMAADRDGDYQELKELKGTREWIRFWNVKENRWNDFIEK